MEANLHTLKAFDEDLDRLRASVCELGGRVEAAITDAVRALVDRDALRAEAVIADHHRVAALASRAEREGVQMIALRAPLADDLREVLSAFKIVGLIARMSDCAANVARRAALIGELRGSAEIRAVEALGQAVAVMVKGALDAYARRDPATAARIAVMDDEVDSLHASLFRGLVDHMTRYPETITGASHLLIAVQKLERAADHAASIAGIIHYAATGAPPAPPARDAAA
jgi:phosphate transport system protein